LAKKKHLDGMGVAIEMEAILEIKCMQSAQLPYNGLKTVSNQWPKQAIFGDVFRSD
jgi:hypothetical protein